MECTLAPIQRRTKITIRPSKMKMKQIFLFNLSSYVGFWALHWWIYCAIKLSSAPVLCCSTTSWNLRKISGLVFCTTHCPYEPAAIAILNLYQNGTHVKLLKNSFRICFGFCFLYLPEGSTMDSRFHIVWQWHEPRVVLRFLLAFPESPTGLLILGVLLYFVRMKKKNTIEINCTFCKFWILKILSSHSNALSIYANEYKSASILNSYLKLVQLQKKTEH